MCGYCDGPCLLTSEGYYECPRCAPLLAEVRTAEEWAAFQREARRQPCAPGQGKLL